VSGSQNSDPDSRKHASLWDPLALTACQLQQRAGFGDYSINSLDKIANDRPEWEKKI